MVLSHVPAGRRRARRPSTQRGETLVEVVVTVVLMGTAFAGIFGGILLVANVTKLNLDDTDASNGVQAYAEGMLQPARSNPVGFYTYVDCATPASYGNVYLPSGAIPAGWTAEIKSVELLRDFSGSGNAPVFDLSVADCYALGGDRGLQRITMEVRSNSTPPAVDTLVVVKRDQECPATFSYADLGPC